MRRLAIACFFLFCPFVFSGDSFVNGRANSGEELTVDLPGNRQMKNIGSKLDGAGMCVFTSIEMAADWAGMPEWKGFRDWCAAKYPGGGYPSKVDKLLADYAKAKGLTVPKYLQYEGSDPDSIMGLIDKTGRCACITYGYSPRYGGAIAHMVCCVKYNGRYGVVLDNNFPGETSYEWMDRAELVRRIKVSPDRHGRQVPSNAWVFVWLPNPPPPPPHN